LDALANASGLSRITGTTSSVDTITVGAGFTNAIEVVLNTGDDNVSASASAAALTISAAAASITTSDTLVGGTGTGDVLSLTADSGVATFGSSLSGFETITIVAATTHTIGITTNDSNVASGGTLTVNAAALASTAALLTFDGSAEINGSFVITGGDSNDTITGGFLSDTIAGGSGNDSIVGGGGNDSLTGGAGVDSITGGAGQDTIVLTETTSVVDTYIFSGSSSDSNIDTIIGWVAGTDLINLTGAAAFLNTSTEALATVTGPNAAMSANKNILVLDFGTYYANDAEVLAALATGDVTLGSDLVSSNTAHVVVVYKSSATSDVRIAEATVADAGGFTAVQDLVILSGVTTFTGIVSTSFILD
jgi:Ca2+-binding RTX toxin-like protein